MIIRNVIDICNVRKQFNKSCHNCVYFGKQCEHVCKILKVDTAKEAYKKTVTLSRNVNSKHALVLPVQKYLKSLGYYKGVCDRDFGAGTEEAVNMYQKKKLKYKKVDGTISSCEKMWKSLLGLK